jgi:hypothetical protein
MKSFSFYKLPVILLCLGGALILAPQSRAQSEIAPDHFDGRDSWADTSAKTLAQRAKPQSTLATPALEPVAAREEVTLRRADATATKRRKPAAPQSNN